MTSDPSTERVLRVAVLGCGNVGAALVGILGIVAAVYNMRQTNVRKPAAAAVPESTR